MTKTQWAAVLNNAPDILPCQACGAMGCEKCHFSGFTPATGAEVTTALVDELTELVTKAQTITVRLSNRVTEMKKQAAISDAALHLATAGDLLKVVNGCAR